MFLLPLLKLNLLRYSIMDKKTAVIRQTLLEMGHPQPPTPIKTDNSTADGIANMSVIPRERRSMDIRSYWVRDRASQIIFLIYWKSGKENLADYFSKHHPPTYHQRVRPNYVIDYPII